ncbi:MAG: hypothetical protein JW902_04960 [Syntrophaceae bacterium]|nr:hypothetical protein [Syntrophaceae bacterium]
MFGLFRKKQPVSIAIREALFGDMPIEKWAESSTLEEPWSSFFKARQFIEKGSNEEAIMILQSIANSNHESRHTLQAWHFLRKLGVSPPENIHREVLGVIVEVGMKGGLDIVAAYSNHSARYYNYSGAAVIWERPDPSLDNFVDNLLVAGRGVIARIGPWEGERPAAPINGEARINFLTPVGLCFGQAPLDTLANDEIGGPVISAALKLMQALMAKSESAKA